MRAVPLLAFLMSFLAACSGSDSPPPSGGLDASNCPSIANVDPPDDCPTNWELYNCIVGDGPIKFWCEDGVVFEHEVTTYIFCPCGTAQEVCRRDSQPFQKLACPAACADTQVHQFDTSDEAHEFDPASLCAP